MRLWVSERVSSVVVVVLVVRLVLEVMHSMLVHRSSVSFIHTEK